MNLVDVHDGRSRPRRAPGWTAWTPLLAVAVIGLVVGSLQSSPVPSSVAVLGPEATWSAEVPVGAGAHRPVAATNATGNLSVVFGRAVFLVGVAAAGVVTLVWSRVAVSWFSHDPSRKVQAKERARDALIGTVILLAAVSGLAWGLAQWVLTGA